MCYVESHEMHGGRGEMWSNSKVCKVPGTCETPLLRHHMHLKEVPEAYLDVISTCPS